MNVPQGSGAGGFEAASWGAISLGAVSLGTAGSFWNAADAMISRVPLAWFAQLKPSEPKKTGQRYITRTTTISPAFPGLNCQVLLTFPLAS